MRRYSGYDANLPSEENYQNLLNHHEKETNFLINEIRKLAKKLDEKISNASGEFTK